MSWLFTGIFVTRCVILYNAVVKEAQLIKSQQGARNEFASYSDGIITELNVYIKPVKFQEYGSHMPFWIVEAFILLIVVTYYCILRFLPKQLFNEEEESDVND